MKSVLLCSLLIICVISGNVFAAVNLYTNRDSFNAEGVITYNYGFEDFAINDFSYPGDPYTHDGITYTTGNNLIIGRGTSYSPISNVLCYDYWTPLTATVDASSEFTMLGFDLGYLGAPGLINLEISTTMDTYSFSNLNVPIASESMNFYGFTAGSGEYFKGLNLSSQYGSGSAPAIDNVTLGLRVSTVPIPSSILLAGIGIIAVGRFLKKR